MEKVMGKWHQIRHRCDRCNRPCEKVLVVSSGPCTGKFCGRQHYLLAKQEMENAKNT